MPPGIAFLIFLRQDQPHIVFFKVVHIFFGRFPFRDQGVQVRKLAVGHERGLVEFGAVYQQEALGVLLGQAALDLAGLLLHEHVVVCGNVLLGDGEDGIDHDCEEHHREARRLPRSCLSYEERGAPERDGMEELAEDGFGNLDEEVEEDEHDSPGDDEREEAQRAEDGVAN